MESCLISTKDSMKMLKNSIEKSRNIFCFTRIVKEFNEEKGKLQPEWETMRKQFQEATRRGETIKTNAKFWEEQANELIQENTETNQRCFLEFFPDCIWRYKRGEDLSTKTKEIRKLMEEKFENVELDRHLPGVERYSSQYYIPFESRKLKYEELLDALRDDNNYITGLQGMGGTGKTTLAKEVGKQLKTSKQFNHVIDTTISFTPDIIKIQDDIAGPLGLKWEDISESDRPKKLWSRLTNGEKILLILDDVWGNLNFDEIGLPNSDNHKGCKVLVTTRNLSVCNKMGCEKRIQLELLNDEEAWIMFKLHANLTDFYSKSILKKGREIATECKRLPVAIATVASSLKGQTHREVWDVALKSLQGAGVYMDGVDDDFVDIYKTLKFSFDNLKDEKAKRLCLLCSVFPEDAEISTEVLARLGIGVGLFGDHYGSYEDARIQAAASRKKLLDSCLLFETKKGDVKMHNLVREGAQWIANKEILAVNFSNKNQKSLVERDKNIKYLLCEGNVKDLFSSKFYGKLEILIVNMNMWDTVDIPISFFGSISGLRVLNLLNKSINLERPTLSLPRSIQLLMNIRSLLVEGVDLGDISILGNLHSLETLDLFQCQIDELPREIANLYKLRLLNLEQCEIRSNNPFEVIQRCPCLEELYFCGSFNIFCQEITLPVLRRYHLTDIFSMMNNSPSKCVSFQKEYFSEATCKYVMQTAEILKLERIKKGWKNLMPEIVSIDQGMNDLIELHLKYDSELQYLVDSKHINSQQVPNVVFSKLAVLHLEEMEKLEELCNGSISLDSFNLEKLSIGSCQHLRRLFKCRLDLCHLKSISIRSCSSLVSVFDLSTSRSLLQLERLVILDCEKLESITYERRVDDTIEEIVDDYDNDNKSCKLMFPNLKVVHVERCPQLQFILPHLSDQDFLLLESITIKSCVNLRYIFDQYQDLQLASLEVCELADLPNFIDICPAMPSSISVDGFKPKTQPDPIKCNIFSLCCYRYKSRSTKIPVVSENQPQVCSISLESNLCWERAQCISRQSNILCYIKKIELFDMSKIKSVFILSTAPKMLLETLTISKCDELKHIIIDTMGGENLSNVFPKLKVINISNCMELEYIIGHYDDGHEIRTEIHLHFSALECLILCKLPSLIDTCPKQYFTTFPPLKQLELNECSQFSIKSIGNFITRSADSTTIKEISGNVESFLALEILKVYNFEVENIFSLNGEQIDFGLRKIELGDLTMMMSLFVGPKNSFDLKNLTWIKIKRCEKLKFVFSTSVLRCLPELVNIRIEECEDLKHIIEDDLENEISSNLENEISSNFMSTKTCFPKLKTLVVVKCNQLKYVFPISISKELPELETLTIREADELEEIFKSESDQKAKIPPNLKFVVIVNLPSLSQAQGIQLQAVEHRFVQNCQIPLTSTSTTNTDIELNLDFGEDNELYTDLLHLFEQLREESKSHDTSNENPSAKTTKVLAVENEVEAASRHGLTSSQELMNGVSTEQPYLMNQQHPLEETDATVKPSKGIEITVEEGTTSTNAKTITSSTHLEFEYGDGQIVTPSFPISTTEPLTVKDVDLGDSQETTQTNNNQVSLNDVDFMNVSSNIEELFPKEDEILVSKGIITSPIASQFPSTSKGDPSQTAEAEHEIVENGLDLEILSVALLPTSSQKLINPQHPLRGIDEHIKPSQRNKGIEISVEEETTLVSTSSGPLVTSQCKPSSQVDVDNKIAMTSFSIAKTETNDKVSLNDDAVMKVRSNIEDLFPKDDEILVSKSRSSSIASKFPSVPSKGDTSHTVEDLSSSLLVKRELEQLVSKNHLAYDDLSLLTDFLVNHPSILLRDTSLSNRYKGYAYNCLAELLKFLQTHSVLDVLGSSHSEFVELLQDVRKCGFDKDLLDVIENRPLFHGSHVSQVASQNFLESKHKLTKHVEDLKHQLASSEAVLESITQQEGHMLETWAALTEPIGY